jgi:hypothetical protein
MSKNLLGFRISLLKSEIWLKPLKPSQQVSQEKRNVNIRMSTFCATTLLICAPLELLTGALLAEVTGKGLHLKEA